MPAIVLQYEFDLCAAIEPFFNLLYSYWSKHCHDYTVPTSVYSNKHHNTPNQTVLDKKQVL
jgi:hypothetical protein